MHRRQTFAPPFTNPISRTGVCQEVFTGYIFFLSLLFSFLLSLLFALLENSLECGSLQSHSVCLRPTETYFISFHIFLFNDFAPGSFDTWFDSRDFNFSRKKIFEYRSKIWVTYGLTWNAPLQKFTIPADTREPRGICFSFVTLISRN